MTTAFQHGLCGCFASPGICCYGYFCLGCLYGSNINKLDGSGCFLNCCLFHLLSGMGCCCLVSKPHRVSLRAKYNLEESPSDCVATYFCYPLAICQEAQEIEYQSKRVASIGLQTMPPQNQIM